MHDIHVQHMHKPRPPFSSVGILGKSYGQHLSLNMRTKNKTKQYKLLEFRPIFPFYR